MQRCSLQHFAAAAALVETDIAVVAVLQVLFLSLVTAGWMKVPAAVALCCMALHY